MHALSPLILHLLVGQEANAEQTKRKRNQYLVDNFLVS